MDKTIKTMIEQHLPVWAGLLLALGCFEVFAMASAFFKGSIFPTGVQQWSGPLSIVLALLMAAPLYDLIKNGLKAYCEDRLPFENLSAEDTQDAIASTRIVIVFFAVMMSMIAPLMLVADLGPWRSIMSGVSGPNLGLPNWAWIPLSVGAFIFTLVGGERVIDTVGQAGDTNQVGNQI